MFDLSFLQNLGKLKISQWDGGITDNVETADRNQFKSMDNLHWTPNGKILYQRGGQKLHDETYPRITSNDDVDAIFELEGFYFYISGRSIYYKSKASPSGFTELLGPTNSHKALPQAGYPNITFWRGHAIITVDVNGATYKSARKIYVDSGGVPRVRTCGLPKVFPGSDINDSTPTGYNVGIKRYNIDVVDYVTTVGSSGPYVIAACYKYSYAIKVNGVTVNFVDYGPACFTDDFYTSDHSAMNNADSVICYYSALANTNDRDSHGWFEECWDTANINVLWFRNVGGIFDMSTESFASGLSISLSTATSITFDWHLYNASLAGYEQLYTNDGTLSNDAPPRSLYHMTGPDNVTWWINSTAGSNRARQSVPGDFDSAPESVYIQTADPLTGGGYFGMTPIFFTKFTAHRTEGLVNSLGQGISTLRTIVGAEGCISHRGIVETPYGLAYPSSRGWAFTNGFQGTNLSADDLSERYKIWTDSQAKIDLIQGVYWPKMKLVIWTVSSDGLAVTDLVALDVSKGVEGKGRFRTFSGLEGIVSLSVMNDELYWGDDAGYVYKWDETARKDIKRDIGESVGSWVYKPILWSLVSPSYDFGDADVEKYLTALELEHRYAESLGIAIATTSDNNSEGFKDLALHEYEDLSPQVFYSGMDVGNVFTTVGSGDPFVNYKANIKVKRNFPLREQRCNRKSIKLSNLLRSTYLSGNYAPSTYDILSTDPAKYQATISSGSWPADVKGMYISFESENYVVKHKITSRASSTVLHLEVLDGAATPELRTNQGWKIYRIADDERPYIVSFSISYLQAGSDRSGTYMTDNGT